MTMTMMRLGNFSFSLDTAAYQTLSRSTEYKWKAQERIGNVDALQYMGRGVDSITLEGVIFTAYRGVGMRQPEEMRRFAGAGTPLLLVSGTGEVFGEWVIEGVDETQSVFIGGGLPRKQQFTIRMRQYGDG